MIRNVALSLLVGVVVGLGTFEAAIAQAAKTDSHVGDCSKKIGVEHARCERHEKMFATCGSIKGPAHHVCDREFLLKNPLDCGALKSKDRGAEKAVASCEAELKAMKSCTEKQGREFVSCIIKEIGESPMGH